MDKELRILIAEDSAVDAEFITRELGKGGLVYTSKWVKSKDEFFKALKEYTPDIILCDYRMPGFGAPEALEIAKEISPQTPFVIVSGTIGEDVAVEMMKSGAVDYIMKDKIFRLAPAVKRALKETEERAERMKAEEGIRSSQERLRILFEHAPDAIYLNDIKGTFIDGNKKAEEITGYTKKELIGKNFLELNLISADQAIKAAILLARNVLGQGTGPDEIILNRKDGKKAAVEIRTFPVKIDNKILILGIARDISERKKMEDNLKKDAQLLKDTGEMAKVGGWELDLATKEVLLTEEVCRIHGVEPGDKLTLEEALNFYVPESRPDVEAVLKKAMETGESYDLESLFVPSGSKDKIWVRSLGRAVYSGGKIVKLVGVFQNIDKYKKAEEELRESRVTLNLILNMIPQSIFWKDLEGRYLGCNQVFAAAVGLEDPIRIVGKTDFDLPWPRAEAEAYRADDRDVIEKNRSKLHIIEALQQADGTRLVIDTSKVPLRDAHGRPFAVLGVYEDITERKKQEERIIRAAEEWRTTFDSITDLVSIVDKDFKITRVNKAFADTFGMNPKDVIGRVCYELVHGAVEPHPDCPYKKSLLTKESTTLEYFEASLGKYLEVSISPIFNDKGDIIAAVHLMRDITERKKAEENIRSLHRRIEFILGVTKTGLDIIDADFNMVYVDPEWAKVYGDYKARKCYEYFMGKREVCADCGIKKAMETKKVVVIEEVLVKEGNRPVQVTTIPFQNENGEWLVAEVNMDISMRKNIEKAQRLAQLGKLVADMAHEVNNPLMIISGNAQLCLMEEIQSQEVKNSLKIIVEESQRAKSIIQRLLKFSRPSKGEIKKVDINNSIESVVGIVEHQFSLVNVKFERTYLKDPPLISIDEQQMQEVFMNLTNNAAEAMPAGGVISITTSLKDDFLCIDFKDTGLGMSEEVKNKLIVPFITTKEKGTGLGLPVCYGIVKAHNGELRFESAPGKGTIVTILLPFAGGGEIEGNA